MLALFAANIGEVGDFITGIATGALAVIALISAIVGLRTYGQQGREKRGRWLMELSARFWSEPTIQTARRDLYLGSDSPITKALRRRRAIRDGESPDVLSEDEAACLVAFDDYFGFFELIERLVASRELTVVEAKALFDWHVQEPMENDVIHQEVYRTFSAVGRLYERFGGRRRAE